MAAAVPEPSEQDLDDALEAVFDTPSTPSAPSQLPDQKPEPQQVSTTPTTPPPTSIPQTPEPSPKKSRPKSILEHLAENKARLSIGAARVAEQLRKLTDASNTNPDNKGSETDKTHDVEDRRNPDSKKPSIAEIMAARRTKKKKQPTKNAFTVIGRDNRPDGLVHETKTYEYVDNNITNMSLIEAPYQKSRLEAIFEDVPRLDIADIKSRYEELSIGALKDYTVYGCLVKKIMKKSAKNGKMYAVWSLCNMPRGKYEDKKVESTVVSLCVFDDAYETFHTRCEGTVFALRKPGLLPRREAGNERLAMKISRKEDVVVLGVCKDFKLCDIRRPGGELCGNWYDANRMTSCYPHMKKRRKAWISGTRMDIQNAVRPNIIASTKGLRAPMDISGMFDAVMENNESGDLERKRKRDSQLARRLKKTRLDQGKKTTRRFPANTHDGVKNKHSPDPMASVARETRQVRNRLTDRHSRLLGRSDRQGRYHEACEILYGLGFKLRTDGGWDPPKKCDLTMVTTQTHEFSGLGKVKRKRGGELNASKLENEASVHGRENERGTFEDDTQGSGEVRNTSEIEHTENVRMEVNSTRPNSEAKKDDPDVPLGKGEETKSQDEKLNKGKDGMCVEDEDTRDSLDAPSRSGDATQQRGEATETNVDETTDEAMKDTADTREESSEETRGTSPGPKENDSKENAEDIILSDESEED